MSQNFKKKKDMSDVIHGLKKENEACVVVQLLFVCLKRKENLRTHMGVTKIRSYGRSLGGNDLERGVMMTQHVKKKIKRRWRA